jgi:hypothetical protein
MLEQLILLASIMPEDFLLDQLTEYLQNYRSNPTEETKKNLRMHLLMVEMKLKEDSVEDSLKTVEEVRKFKEMQNLTKDIQK